MKRRGNSEAIGPRDAAPPPAKLKQDSNGKEWWVCYWCENGLIPAGFAELAERETARCTRCEKFQVVGTSEQIRLASQEADKTTPIAGSRDQAPSSRPAYTSHDRRSMNRLSAALERQQDRDGFAILRRKRQTAQLPDGFDQTTLAEIQRVYDDVKARYGKVPKTSVAHGAKKSRNTVEKYWQYVKK